MRSGGINVPGYTSSTSGIAGLTKALAIEWAPRGVTVNAIAGRWGRPDDLAGSTVFLASHASDDVTGVTLPVDGGWLGR